MDNQCFKRVFYVIIPRKVDLLEDLIFEVRDHKELKCFISRPEANRICIKTESYEEAYQVALDLMKESVFTALNLGAQNPKQTKLPRSRPLRITLND
jgi:hypothetical protein